ncbi:MAG: hypothetical protein AAFP02_10135 [Bacteroidota bacterium]
MRDRCLRLTLFFILQLPATFILLAQQRGVIQEDLDQRFRFALRVKQIDEFFERFNGEPSQAQEYIANHYPDRLPIPRAQHLWWIMDQTVEWDSLTRDAFLRDVCDGQSPAYLSFYDRAWFAELDCQFTYRGVEHMGKLILHIQADENFASKWVISSLVADFVPDSCLGPYPYPIYRATDRNKLIRPTNHVPNFAGLGRVFRDSCCISHYFSNRYTSSSLFFLEEAVQAGDLEIQFVRKIRYHFMQLDNWIITVENFNRKDWNAGWLISDIIPASPIDKERYLSETLNLP